MKKKQEYITKDFFIEYMEQFRKEVIDLFKAASEYAELRVHESENALRKDIVQFKDEILGEIVSLRQEVAVINGTREVLEDHEHRIVALERRGSS